MKKASIGNTVFEITKGDITQQETEAIVNAANKQLAPGGGVAGAIHRAAGPRLWEECRKLGGCNTGEAKLTLGYQLQAKNIIHTVGPVFSGNAHDADHLRQCFINCLKLAENNGITSVSFPAISTGAFGYPLREAAEVSLSAVIEYLKKETSLKLVRFVLYTQNTYEVYSQVFYTLWKNTSKLNC